MQLKKLAWILLWSIAAFAGRGYAENLKAPFAIFSNGREHWFWKFIHKDQDACRIERLPSLEDLERLRLKNPTAANVRERPI